MVSQSTFLKPPKSLLRSVGRAIADYKMISPDDRILIAVSGGKDSLTLLNILLHIRRHAPIKFDLAAITVDPQMEGFDPSPLKAYMASMGITYYYQSQPITHRAVNTTGTHTYCSFYSRMKRNIMYATARREKYNVLALAQHLDDFAECFLLSAFQGGQLRSMQAKYFNDAGNLRVIRPLIYTREHQTTAFANAANLPIIADNCEAALELPTPKQHVKTLLATEEQHNKQLFQNLLTTLRPLLSQSYSVRNSDIKA